MTGSMLLASEGAAFNSLPWLVFVPIIGAIVVALAPARVGEYPKQLAILFSSATGALTLYLLFAFESGDPGMQFVVNNEWISSVGIGWRLGVDGISLFLVVLTGLLFPLALAAVKPDHDPKQYYAWMLLLMAGSLGVFMALDLVLFFLFFEVVLVPMYFLIGLWGHGRKVYAANKFFLYTMAGSALMFVGILATGLLHQASSGGPLTFDLVEIAESQSIAAVTTRWLFAAFALAFAVKVPLFPLHTWLPDAHTEAPTAGSVILAGVMLKLGTYGFLRFGLYLFPDASDWFAPVFLTLGVIGILYGAAAATMQRDLKRLVAYSSVAHLGFIILGTFAFTIQGIEGGVLQMVNHGITTPALFLMVGMIYERRHTREISELSGLQKVAPIMAGTFTLVMLASIGLPGLNGFVGEFLTLIGAFQGARWWAVVATTGVVLAALYMLWAYQRVFHGPVTKSNRSMKDMSLREGMVMMPLVILMIVLGLFPKPLLDRIEPSVDALIVHVADHSDVDISDVPAPVADGSTSGSGGHEEDGDHE
jgi:NADH-quinone oxidoreductase subunit M